jgi:A/G-specific adenine glycosylase
MLVPERTLVLGLFDWFDKNGIEYPWGVNPEPYRVWISEIMLQQTVVTTVIPFFESWMHRFPDIYALAAADEETVLRQWEGLGYYSRAVNIRKAAQCIVYESGGVWPADPVTLAKLPGIGPYTAAALASFSFGADIPVFDANVRRILCRFNAMVSWPAGGDTVFTEFLSGSLKRGDYARWNGSIMQLGQLVCKNATPVCQECPFLTGCRAGLGGKGEFYPEKKIRTKIQKYSERMILVFKNEVLMEKQQAGIGKGLWIFPVRDRIQNRFETGDELFLGDFVYNYTNNRELLKVFKVAACGKNLPDGSAWAWVPLDKLESLPVPSVFRKIIKKLVD